MTGLLSVTQGTPIANAFSGTGFGSNVPAGATVFLVVVTFNTANVTISSSAPTFAGSPVAGSAELLTGSGVQSAFQSGTGTVYVAIWALPDVAGGSAAVGVTVTNGTTAANVGILPYYVLGAPLVTDRMSSASAANTTAVNSGTTAAIRQAPEFALGAAAVWNGMAAPGAPWTSQGIGTSPFSATSGYQVPGNPAGTYAFSGTQSSGAPWAAGVVTLFAPIAPAQQYRLAARRAAVRAFSRSAAGAAAASSPGIAGTVPAMMINRTELMQRTDARIIRR